MSRGSYGQHARQLALASSVAALTAACSQTGNPPSRAITGDGSRASLSRPLFSESEYGPSSARVTGLSGPVRKGGGSYKLGSPYRIAGRWYVPREEPGYDRQGRGSWYGDDFHGRKTANGEIFDMRALTAAHPTLPLPSYAYVTNLANGRTILVRVNDRGPYANDRIIDMSHASARALGYEGAGTANVRVRYAGRAPLNGDDRRERQFFAEQRWNRGGGMPEVAAVRPPDAPVFIPEPFPAGTPGRWSAAGYRAALAGKSPPAPPQKYAGRYDGRYAAVGAYQPISSTDSLPPRQAAFNQTSYQPSYQPPYQSSGAPSGRVYVQVGTFRDRNNAERLRRDLATLGPIEVAPLAGAPGGELYRVRLGPMTAAAAGETLGQITARGIIGSTVVTE